MHRGYIKLYRKLLEWEWYKDSNCVRLFLHLLLKANFKDNKWKGIEVKKGQLITSIKHLSEETGLSEQQVRSTIKKLISTNEITSKATNKFTIITIEKYSLHQADEKEITNKTTSKVTNEQQTNNKQITNKQQQLKNVKNVENVKNVKNIICVADDLTELDKAMIDFEEFRKKIKKPLTDRAKKLILNELNKLANTEQEMINILNQSIMNGWQGIFPLKTDYKNEKTFESNGNKAIASFLEKYRGE